MTRLSLSRKTLLLQVRMLISGTNLAHTHSLRAPTRHKTKPEQWMSLPTFFIALPRGDTCVCVSRECFTNDSIGAPPVFLCACLCECPCVCVSFKGKIHEGVDWVVHPTVSVWQVTWTLVSSSCHTIPCLTTRYNCTRSWVVEQQHVASFSLLCGWHGVKARMYTWISTQ